MPNKTSRFWQELKRRNVPRVVTIYAGTAFIILEAVDMIFPRWGLPDWTIDLVLYLLLVGAVVAIVVSWMYDLSPSGIVKTAPIEEAKAGDDGGTIKTNDGKKGKVSGIIIAVLIVIIGLLLYPKIFRDSSSPLSGSKRNSIAVMPLKVIGGDTDLSFFASGLVESLSYMLTKVGDRENSFSVIPPSELVEAITAHEARKKFGVSLVISGSIQVDQTSNRLILNLIDTKTQKLIQSERLYYSREKNLIIQDEVISVMVSMLGLELEQHMKDRITLGGSTLYDANEFYLTGRGILREGAESVADIDAALELFSRAIERDSLFALAYAGKGQAFNLKYHFTSDVRWLDESLKFNLKAIELNDQDAEVLRALANSLVEKGEFEEALNYYEKSKSIDSSQYAIYTDMAYLYELTGDLFKAEAYNKRAVQIDPDSPLTHYYLGVFYYFQLRYDEAINEIERALELSPGHLTILNVLGACYFAFEEFEKAIAVFEEIIDQDPTQGMSFQNLGSIYYYKGDFEKSVNYYQEAVRMLPRDFSIHGALARAYLRWGKRDQAYSSLQEAINIGHQDYTCSDLHLATWFGLMGRKDSALYYIKKSELDANPAYHPDSLDAANAFFIGDLYLIMDSIPVAITYFESALTRRYGWIEINHSPDYSELFDDPAFKEMLERSVHSGN